MANKSYVAGLDIGNGYVKAEISGRPGFSYQSMVAYVTSMQDIKTKEAEAGAVIEDIYDQMYASFDTPIVKNSVKRLFGRRGLLSGMPLEMFDVNSHMSKASSDLSSILVLGTMAGRVLQDYWKKAGKLPEDTLMADCRISLALPIDEYKSHKDEYADKFLKYKHMVTIHNFEQPVRIELTFSNVDVLAEGESAQYGILYEGEPLMNAMLADVRRMGEPLEGIEASDVLACQNSIGVDIGEGTVNFPVFVNGKFSPESSSTMTQGYGHVLERAINRLQAEGSPFKTRKELSEFLQKTPSKLARRRYDHAMEIVKEETVAFAESVKMSFVGVMNKIGGFTEVVFVYGGGATPVQKELHQRLIDAMHDFNEFQPVLYLDSSYSRKLNCRGLLRVAESHVARDAEAAQAQKGRK